MHTLCIAVNEGFTIGCKIFTSVHQKTTPSVDFESQACNIHYDGNLKTEHTVER